MQFEKLSLLCNSYNYLFDEALEVAEAALQKADDYDKCFFLLMSGLVLLKKKNDRRTALAKLDEGFTVAQRLDSGRLRVATEKAFLANAVNLVKLLDAAGSKESDDRHAEISLILDDEHRILQVICAAFVATHRSKLADQVSMLSALFIITTIVENITKLNALCGFHYDTIEIYRTYEYILDTTATRIGSGNYKNSYVISYSHALFHNRVTVAKYFGQLKLYQRAYEVTRDLLQGSDQYDVTGDYRGFALNAHAINAGRLELKEEAIDCLIETAEIYVAYNEPYLIRSSLSSLADFIATHHPAMFDELQSLGLIDRDHRKHDESSLLVSSSVDLENPLLGGIEQLIFGTDRSTTELRSHSDHPGRDLRAAFRTYGLWRQIHGARPTGTGSR